MKTRKEKKWRIHPAASAGADANGAKEPQLHSPVCAGCEQFAFKGTPLAQSWMEVPLMGIVGVIYCWHDSLIFGL
jgi:hypothetical protein